MEQMLYQIARNCPPGIEASHFQSISVNLTIHHPNISSDDYPWILTQSCVMTASIEMKSSESEAPL